MTLNDIIQDAATIIGVLIALFTFIQGVLEYRKQGAQKRVEQFMEVRRRLKENERFKEIADLLETDDPKLSQLPFKDKRDFLGLFEEVALMLNSGLIQPEVAHYMFGYYAIKCWDSAHFWNNISRDSKYWTVFREFVKKMENIEKSFKYKHRLFKF